MAKTKTILERFSVTVPRDLLKAFDRATAAMGYATRSEAVGDLMREALLRREAANPEAPAAGVVALVYNHQERRLAEKLTGRQHETFHDIVASLHVHLDKDSCLEIVVLRGRAEAIRRTADALISLKGVKFGRFLETAAGRVP